MPSQPPTLPEGTVTFLFSDIENSTRLWETHPRAMKAALARHDQLLRAAVSANSGHTIKTTGDGIHAVFPAAHNAVSAARDGQLALLSESWEQLNPDSIRVRVGIHTGEAERRDGDYYGPAVNRAARVMSIGHGGQVLLSGVTAAILTGTLEDSLVLDDLGDTQLRGLNRSEHIYQLVAPGLPTDFPPLNSSGRRQGNLPAAMTTFIGREREKAEVEALLPDTRLLTLTGPGGTGKTRLSLEVAADVSANYADDVWLVELAPLADPDNVASAVASLWGLNLSPEVPVMTTLAEYLRSKELLLVLDNCEHLVEACAQLAATLLPAAPGLTILASSREGLGVPGETTYHLHALRLPQEHDIDPDSLLLSDSIRLFVDRAQSALPDFQLTANNAEAINHIVHRLDGIPLAIELAAARLKMIPVKQLAAGIDDRFRLLTGGSRTALPRQQTLRALIDWSYDLLDPVEQAFFRQLAVFAGGWTWTSAEGIVDLTELEEAPAAPSRDTFDLLDSMVSKSLVIMEDDEGEARFHFLETIRQYAREMLFESSESVAAQDRHLAYFKSTMLDAGFIAPKMDYMTAYVSAPISDYMSWVGPFASERENITRAIEWAMETNAESAVALTSLLALTYAVELPVAELGPLIEEALQKLDASAVGSEKSTAERSLLRVNALAALGNMHLDYGFWEPALGWLLKAEEEARQAGMATPLAMVLTLRLLCEENLGLPDIRRVADESLTIFTTQGQHTLQAIPLAIVAIRDSRDGYQQRAEETWEQSLHLVRGTGTIIEAMVYMELGAQLIRIGRLDIGLPLLEDAADLFGRQNNATFVSYIRGMMGSALVMKGDREAAGSLYRQLVQDLNLQGNPVHWASAVEAMAGLAAADRQFATAVELMAAADALRQRLQAPLLPFEIDDYAALQETVQGSLEKDSYESAWRRGSRLSVDEATELALSAI